MSEAFFIVVAVLLGIIILSLLFRTPLAALINRSRSVDVEVSKDGLKAAFRTDLEDLARESSATATAVEVSNPGRVEPTASQLALPGGISEQSDPGSASRQTAVTVRGLIAIGADWGGLIREAKQLLAENQLPEPENHPSLGELLQAFDSGRPGILPERAEDLASEAEQLLQKLMTVESGEVTHEDVRLFSIALSSLHKIISKSASKARHPSRIGLPKT